MHRRQPDNQIRPENLGLLMFNGFRFVINLRPGAPFNACVEEFEGKLRCWASRDWLDTRAAMLIDEHASKTDAGTFIWNKDVRRGPVACMKGGRKLYKVEFS